MHFNHSLIVSLLALSTWCVHPALQAETPLSMELQKVEEIVLGMGCFWGAEKRLSAIKGVLDVEAGYAGGDSPETNYRKIFEVEKQIRAGQNRKNHAEVVRVRFDPRITRLETVLAKFWESHDPTQVNRQGNDIGTNYRSAIYYLNPKQKVTALLTMQTYADNLASAGIKRMIATEILPLKNYVKAEIEHQDYLVKNPNGYCGLGGLGVPFVHQNSRGVQTQKGRVDTPRPVRKLLSDPIKDWNKIPLNAHNQLIVFAAEDCGFCEKLHNDITSKWQASIPLQTTYSKNPPPNWQLAKPLLVTPTIVMFKDGREIGRQTGYTGDSTAFWRWFGQYTLDKKS